MTDRNQDSRRPFKSPQWLLAAAKKRSGAPSNVLLSRLQYAREHPNEVARKLQANAIQSGRDPAAVSKLLAECTNNAQQARLAQRSKDVRVTVVEEDFEDAVDRNHPSDAEETAPRGNSAESQARPATQSTARPTQPFATVQRRVGANGQVTKPNHPQVWNERGSQRDRLRNQTPESRVTSGTSCTASPMVIDGHQSLAQSSASGPVREPLNAAPRELEVQDSSIARPVAQPYSFPSRSTMPAWYTSVSQQSQALLQRRRPQEVTAIDALKACTERCFQEKDSIRLTKEYDDLRNHVHKAEIRLDMDKVKVKVTRILTPVGLPRIFHEQANLPWDIKADAWHLYERWMDQDFDNDILRGIVTVKAKDRNGDRLDPAYRQKHPKDTKIFGDNGAIVGQWWPSQLCAVRDGVHGAAQGGIYGDKDRGASSIVLSSGGYHDRDDGDVIAYSGTEGANFEIKAATQSMITSTTLGNHIRVLRSSQLPKHNKYRPSCGIRYDGLYQINSYEEIDVEKQIYRFHLERIPGQEPIRFEGVTKRPTVFEEEAYERCKGRV